MGDDAESVQQDELTQQGMGHLEEAPAESTAQPTTSRFSDITGAVNEDTVAGELTDATSLATDAETPQATTQAEPSAQEEETHQQADSQSQPGIEEHLEPGSSVAAEVPPSTDPGPTTAAAPAQPEIIELPPLPDDYVPVAELPPLPFPYDHGEDGKPIPLQGVESIFLTGTTLEIVGLVGLGKAAGRLMTAVPKDKLLADIQFRGAISDFHPFKARIVEADYDPIVFRANEDDVYGDGNNFEMAVHSSAAELWLNIEEETIRRHELAELEAQRAELEKKLPKSKRPRIVKPWKTLGSEVEIEEAAVRNRRDLIQMVVQRPRRDFNQMFKFSDKDAHELWNSSQMECRPFKDPNFDLRRMEQDVGCQAVAPVRDQSVQATGDRPRPASTQYEPLDLAPEAKAGLLQEKKMAHFLERVRDQCEQALIQNEVVNIFRDDFIALSEEDGISGNRKESIVSESQSFTHLTYSKNKVVTAVQWLPHRKGVVAVACTEAVSHADRVARAGRPNDAYILIWNFKDPINPEYVLQAPFEVYAFQYNPLNPELVAAGCYNGQVVMWDTTHEHDRIAKAKNSSKEQDANDEAAIPVVKYRYQTDVQFSHHSGVTDLQWLPGVDITHRGKVTCLAEGNKECNFFVTVAADGKVMFWDTRFEKLMKKGRKVDDLLDMIWKPVHTVGLISLQGLDLGGIKCCFNFKQLENGKCLVSSEDGELVQADFVKPDGEENPDYMKSCVQAHVGPIVSLERSPFYDDIILTVGDWSFQIWREGQSTPLFQSGFARDYYTAGCWSPTRPAVVYLVDQAGALEIWDMLDRSHEPSIRVVLASTPLVSIAFNPTPAGSAAAQAANQQFAVGDSSGVLRILELPRNFKRAVHNEKKLMGQWLDREAERVTDSAARAPQRASATKDNEERKKAKEAEAEAAAKDAATKDQQGGQTAADGSALVTRIKASHGSPAKQPVAVELDERMEAEYLKLEAKFKAQLGIA